MVTVEEKPVLTMEVAFEADPIPLCDLCPDCDEGFEGGVELYGNVSSRSYTKEVAVKRLICEACASSDWYAKCLDCDRLFDANDACLYNTNLGRICSDCSQDYSHCVNCGDLVPDDEVERYDGDPYCSSCGEDMRTCDQCNSVHDCNSNYWHGWDDDEEQDLCTDCYRNSDSGENDPVVRWLPRIPTVTHPDFTLPFANLPLAANVPGQYSLQSAKTPVVLMAGRLLIKDRFKAAGYFSYSNITATYGHLSIVDGIDFDWSINHQRGSVTKRLSKWMKDEGGVSLTEEDKNFVGDIVTKYAPKPEMLALMATRRSELPPEYYCNKETCWHSMKDYVPGRHLFWELGGVGLMLLSDKDSTGYKGVKDLLTPPIARVWLWPLYWKEGGNEWALCNDDMVVNNPDGYVLFNPYDAERNLGYNNTHGLDWWGNVVSGVTGWNHKRIQFSPGSQIYVNGDTRNSYGSGMLVCPDDHAGSGKDVTWYLHLEGD